MGKSLFITGTDTGAGKTVVTGLLGRYLLSQGCNVVTQKWVETGSCDRRSHDIRHHDAAMGRLSPAGESARIPYVFKTPCSPHLAARLEKKRIVPAVITKSLAYLEEQYDCVLIEGAGGILVPVTGTVLLIDIVRQMKIPVLVVVNNKLGAINHALLTLESLKARRIPVLGLIFNAALRCEDYIARDNPLTIGKFSGIPVLGSLNYSKDRAALYKQFIPIGEKIWQRLQL